MSKKIELIGMEDVPQDVDHVFEHGEVARIKAEDLCIGDVIMVIGRLCIIDKITENGDKGWYDLYVHSITESRRHLVHSASYALRVLNAWYTDPEGKDWGQQFIRKRFPILGEPILCAVCQGTVRLVEQSDIGFFKDDRGSYDPLLDVHQSYCGCEDTPLDQSMR